MSTDDSATLSVVESAREIPEDVWDALANPSGGELNPFLRRAFFVALEESKSASERAGWKPLHFVLKRDERIVAIMPCYLKSHSFGEYVFDYAWADAWSRVGGVYYPKLTCALPFTPVAGRRFFVGESDDSESRRAMLASGATEACRRLGASSLHVLFASDDDARACETQGFLRRVDRQFHWLDRGFGDFNGFLSSLSSRKRKTLAKERREALSGDASIRRLEGGDIREEHWDAFFKCYLDTGRRKWGHPYLTREFFSRLGESMSENLLLLLCERSGRPIAGALHFIGSDALYGRWWGATETRPFLHFEACYYQAIDIALELGLSRVEAGAQGGHKLARGYVPIETRSLHYFVDDRLGDAVGAYLRRERAEVAAVDERLRDRLPFRRDRVVKPSEEMRE